MFQALERAGCFPLIPTPGTWVCSSGPRLINYSLKYVKIKRYSLHTSQQAIFWDCSGTNDLIQIDIVCVLVWADTQLILAQGSSENLVIGSGGGQFGLWFDADLNKGRTQRCDTFANPPLTPSSDFCVYCLECWAFLPSTWGQPGHSSAPWLVSSRQLQRIERR